MKRTFDRGVFAGAAVLAACLLASRTALAQDGRGMRHALLVGVADYPELERQCREAGEADRYRSRIQLRGPVHDVARMRETLEAVLEVPSANLRTLAGWPDAAADRPTRANIERELQRLAATARAGDLVVVYLSGHGAQVPDVDGDERDGLDEVFLAADTRRWDQAAGVAPGAIRDDELAAWIGAIRKQGARVLFFADACFSGTLLRGDGDEERARVLQPEMLGLPEPPVTVRQDPLPEGEDPLLQDLGDGVAAMFAVDARQQAVECRMPRRDGTWHGVFTWHLTQQLARSGPGVSMSELQRQVATALAADHRGHLVPTLMGAVDRALVDGAPAGLRLQVGRRDGGWYVTGGAVCGLQRGDVLEVFEPGRRGDPKGLLGRVAVEAVFAVASAVKPDAASRLAAVDASASDLLPASVARTTLELRRLRLVASGGLPQAIGAALGADEEFTRRAEWTTEPAGADGIVTFAPDGSGTLTAAGVASAERLPFAAGGLTETVFRLYRARSLRRLAQDLSLASVPAGLTLRLELLDDDGAVLRELRPGEHVLPGTRVRIAVENRSERDWDVYAFGIDAACGVSVLLPAGAQSPTVACTDRKRVEHVLRFNDTTLGAEQVLFVAVPAGAPDLRPLAHDFPRSQQVTRGVGAAALVTDLVGGRDARTTRGLGDEDGDVAAVRLLPYVVAWGTRPAEVPGKDGAAIGDVRELSAAWRRCEGAAFRPAVDEGRARGIGDVYGTCAESIVALRNRLGYGTGFLIDAERGLLVTNHHVVADGLRFSDRGRWVVQVLVGKLDEEGMMKLWRDDIVAEVVHDDARRDLALLEVRGPRDWLQGRKALALAERAPRPASECVILGHPSSGMLWSFRPGSVSAIGSFPHDQVEDVMALCGLAGATREAAMARLVAEPRLEIVMSTCGANRGDSGGPLVDADGRVLGVTFAVPRDAHDKEFTYHLHPRELRAFLDAAPAAGAALSPQVPEAWRLGARVVWQPDHPLGVGVCSTATEGAYSALLVDFDRDSTLEPTGDGERIAAVFGSGGGGGAIDAEIVLQFTAGEQIAHYDSDGDGAFDLVLVNNDDDEAADVQFERVGGGWRCEHRERPLLQLQNLGGAFRSTRSDEYRNAARALGALLR